MTKKEDGGFSVASALSFNSAHKDNGDIIGKFMEMYLGTQSLIIT